jgi:hypothetical protein
MPIDKLPGITALLKAHLAAEAQAGFPRLTRTPSTAIVQFLDYYAALAAADRESLLDALSQMGALRFLPLPLVQSRLQAVAAAHPALLRYRRALQSPRFTVGLRYVEPRMRMALLTDPAGRETMAEARRGLDFVPRDDPPAALVADPDPARATTAKAPLLRRLIDSAFKKLFAGEKHKRPGGETEYAGTLDGTRLSVAVDFAAMGCQLRYDVSIPISSEDITVSRLAYEDLWTSGAGWNYLTGENAVSSIALLCDHIAQIVSLRNRILHLPQ